ncbi:hypothetical protein ASPCAL07955 [Aspergillus calidoustus]|uniref:Nucleoside phosphorylase domain-containing protein n=1 Tax=Aspergillus calidoustus TaxID=454130 RepID=A0A0U5CPU5_ASPCI|nr:hypothetical protein ASPCAL07955 [Aspergillus calidoustus]
MIQSHTVSSSVSKLPRDKEREKEQRNEYMMPTAKNLAHNDYKVGWLCALPLEMAAAQAMLDEIHEDLPVQPNDHNAYILGKMGNHNIVIAGLPSGEYGLVSSATVAVQLLSTFHCVRFGLLVGIGGGVPSKTTDVRLGDIVVSKPTRTHGGVMQYDYGKAVAVAGESECGGFERTGMLNRPPQILLTALTKLQASYDVNGSRIPYFLKEVRDQYPSMQAKYTSVAGGRLDQLFKASYMHPKSRDSCDRCDPLETVIRPKRANDHPVVHYGLIASGNKVVKDSQFRDRLGRDYGVLCVEMEAAGLMNNFPCLVIRGICDYADSHKNKNWQGYAASVAAAYAKELLFATSCSEPDQMRNFSDDIKVRPLMDRKADQRVQAQRPVCGICERCQSLDYCMPLDTNLPLTQVQSDQITQFISSQQSVDPLQSLRFAAALSRRHTRQARSDLIDIGQFWLHPRFRKWESNNQNDLVFIKGDYKSHHAIRSFCVDFIELVRRQNSPVIWTLQVHKSTACPGPNTLPTTDVLQDLVCQTLHLSKSLRTEKDASTCCAQISDTQSPMQWMDLLGRAVSSLPMIYILLEVSTAEQFSWVEAFLWLFGTLNKRECRTRVKVVLVAGTTSAALESQMELRLAEQHQLVIPAHSRRLLGRSVPRGTLLVRRRKY